MSNPIPESDYDLKNNSTLELFVGGPRDGEWLRTPVHLEVIAVPDHRASPVFGFGPREVTVCEAHYRRMRITADKSTFVFRILHGMSDSEGIAALLDNYGKPL